MERRYSAKGREQLKLLNLDTIGAWTMPPIRQRRNKSIFWQVFWGVIAALIAIKIISGLLQIGLIAGFLNAASTAIKTNHQPQPATTTRPTTEHDRLAPLPEPIKTTTRLIQNEIQKMGDAQLAHIKDRHLERKNETNDMPPWEHPGQWAQLKGTDRPCWVHVKTAKKVCQ